MDRLIECARLAVADEDGRSVEVVDASLALKLLRHALGPTDEHTLCILSPYSSVVHLFVSHEAASHVRAALLRHPPRKIRLVVSEVPAKFNADDVEGTALKLQWLREVLTHVEAEPLVCLAGGTGSAAASPLIAAALEGRGGIDSAARFAETAQYEGLLSSAAGYCEVGAEVLRGRAHALGQVWRALLDAVDRAASLSNLLPMTEKRLEGAALAANSCDDDIQLRVFFGGRDESAKPKALHSAGSDGRAALHMLVRIADCSSPDGLRASRTYFLSNGALCRHWQHRIFATGEVLEPLVEDAAGSEPPILQETARLIHGYARLCAAARAVADLCARECPRRVDDGEVQAAALCVLAGPEASPPRVQLTRAAGAKGCPAEWLLHHVKLETADGKLEVEFPFVLDGVGGWQDPLQSTVPTLCCWMAHDAEAREANKVYTAIEEIALCSRPEAPVERLRAGEHSVLQVLVAEPCEGTLLFDVSVFGSVSGEVRLFSEGLAFFSVRHGPLVVPFRIQCAAVDASHLGGGTSACRGVLSFEVHPGAVAYGPLAALGGDGATRVALDVEPHTQLSSALERAWPHWARLFASAGIPVRCSATL